MSHTASIESVKALYEKAAAIGCPVDAAALMAEAAVAMRPEVALYIAEHHMPQHDTFARKRMEQLRHDVSLLAVPLPEGIAYFIDGLDVNSNEFPVWEYADPPMTSRPTTTNESHWYDWATWQRVGEVLPHAEEIRIRGNITSATFDPLWVHCLRHAPPHVLNLDSNRMGESFKCSPAFLDMIRHPRVHYVILTINNFDMDEIREIRYELDDEDDDNRETIRAIKKLIFIPSRHLEGIARMYPAHVIETHRRYYLDRGQGASYADSDSD